jgi:hypothetical protein
MPRAGCVLAEDIFGQRAIITEYPQITQITQREKQATKSTKGSRGEEGNRHKSMNVSGNMVCLDFAFVPLVPFRG